MQIQVGDEVEWRNSLGEVRCGKVEKVLIHVMDENGCVWIKVPEDVEVVVNG